MMKVVGHLAADVSFHNCFNLPMLQKSSKLTANGHPFHSLAAVKKVWIFSKFAKSSRKGVRMSETGKFIQINLI
jgi:hypothetical protein